MILEGIVTTLSPDGVLNVAPMGPIVDPQMRSLLLRPFQTSQTFANLQQRREGVFHVVDDVLLLAKAAIGELEEAPDTFNAEHVTGRVLKSACRWYEFEVEEMDVNDQRAELRARVVHSGRVRDYFGLNRAKHAVLEAAILATRVEILPVNEIIAEFDRLKVPVEKTAGPTEREAFELLLQYVNRHR